MDDVQGAFIRVDVKQDIFVLESVIRYSHDSLRVKLFDFLDHSVDQTMLSRSEVHG